MATPDNLDIVSQLQEIWLKLEHREQWLFLHQKSSEHFKFVADKFGSGHLHDEIKLSRPYFGDENWDRIQDLWARASDAQHIEFVVGQLDFYEQQSLITLKEIEDAREEQLISALRDRETKKQKDEK